MEVSTTADQVKMVLATHVGTKFWVRLEANGAAQQP